MSKTQHNDRLLVGTLIVGVAAVVIGGTAAIVNRVRSIAAEQTPVAAPATDEAPRAGNLRLGEKFPNITLRPADEAPAITTAQLLDGQHYVVVNFHHPDCPCAANCATLINTITADESYGDVRFVGIMSSDTRDRRVLAALAEQIEEGVVTYPVYMDHDQTLMRQLGARRTPEVWVLDKDGTIAYHGAPESTLAPGSRAHRYLLREALDALKAGRQPEVRHMESIGCLIEPAG